MSNLLINPIVADYDAGLFRIPPRNREQLIWLRDYCTSLAAEFVSEEDYAAAIVREVVEYKINSEESAKGGWIYLCKNLRNGLFKIGYSKTPSLREKTLQAEEPELQFMTKFEGTKANEMELHQHFAGSRVRGEWFRLSGDDFDWIETYRARLEKTSPGGF